MRAHFALENLSGIERLNVQDYIICLQMGRPAKFCEPSSTRMARPRWPVDPSGVRDAASARSQPPRINHQLFGKSDSPKQ